MIDIRMLTGGGGGQEGQKCDYVIFECSPIPPVLPHGREECQFFSSHIAGRHTIPQINFTDACVVDKPV